MSSCYSETSSVSPALHHMTQISVRYVKKSKPVWERLGASFRKKSRRLFLNHHRSSWIFKQTLARFPKFFLQKNKTMYQVQIFSQKCSSQTFPKFNFLDFFFRFFQDSEIGVNELVVNHHYSHGFGT